jgi:PHD/YefM family antitoxin component YafN of YafNO toxin-antitoxin module
MSRPSRISNRIRAPWSSRRPIVIAEAGKPSVVLVDAAAFERIVKAMNLARLLAEGEADLRAGRVQPLEEVVRELEQQYGYNLTGRKSYSRRG